MAKTKRQSGQHGRNGQPISQATFLRHFADTFNVKRAAKAAKISHQTVYNWLKASPEFAERFAAAKQEAVDDLEAEARRRAIKGSDTLLIFLLKGLKPDVYRDRVDQRFEGTVNLAGAVTMYLPDNGRQAAGTQ